MANTKVDVKDLIHKIFHPNSSAKKGLDALADRYHQEGNSQGIAAIKGLVKCLQGKAIKEFSGRIELVYASYHKYAKGINKGTCDFCGQGLRKANNISVRCIDNRGDNVAQAGRVIGIGATGMIGEIQCGNDHWAHWQQIAEAIEEKNFVGILSQRTERRERKCNKLRELGTLKPETAALFAKIGVAPENYELMKQVLDFGPGVTKADKSIFAALDYSSFRKGDLNWLLKNKKYLPEKVEDALDSLLHDVIETSDEETETIFKAIYQFKPYGLDSLIGGIKSDLLYLDKLDGSNSAFNDFQKPDLEAVMHVPEFIEPKTSYRKRTIREKLKEILCTRAEAIGILRAAPGLFGARQRHNREIAAEYFSTAQEFKDAYAAAATVLSEQKQKLADYHKKKIPVQWKMLQDEYKSIKFAQTLVEKARSENSRDALLRLLPMADARQVLGAIAMVARKKELCIEQGQRIVQFGYEQCAALGKAEQSYAPVPASFKWLRSNSNRIHSHAKKGVMLAEDARKIAGIAEKLGECTALEEKEDEKRKYVQDLLQKALVVEIKGVSGLNALARAVCFNKKGRKNLEKAYSAIKGLQAGLKSARVQREYERLSRHLGKIVWSYGDFSGIYCEKIKLPYEQKQGITYFGRRHAANISDKFEIGEKTETAKANSNVYPVYPIEGYLSMAKVLQQDKDWMKKLEKLAKQDGGKLQELMCDLKNSENKYVSERLFKLVAED